MHVPPHFSEPRPEVVAALLRQAGFGHLTVAGEDGLASTPVPFLVDDDVQAVRTHLARANPVWRHAPCAALLIVPVTDAYVSPSWYPSKQAHGKVVPTWNYEVVHLHGRLVVHDDAGWLRRQITDLTAAHEATMPTPWAVTDAPSDYVSSLLGAIVGIELAVDRVVTKRKLSQNRPEPDAAGATAGLARAGARGAGVAAAMAGLGGAGSTRS